MSLIDMLLATARADRADALQAYEATGDSTWLEIAIDAETRILGLEGVLA